MNLLKTYMKLIFIRNKTSYLFVTLSIIATYIATAILMIYIDNVLILSSDYIYPNFRYLYVSIRTVFIVAGVSFVINQYYNIMKSGLKDYCILKTIGATKQNIRMLILIQAMFLMFITIPIGLFSGFLLTKIVLKSLGDFSLNRSTIEIIDSINIFFIAAAVAGGFIISIGIYLDRGIRKMSLTNILSVNPTIGKDMYDTL